MKYYTFVYKKDNTPVEWAHTLPVYSHKWKAEVRRKEHPLRIKIKTVKIEVTIK